MREKTENGFPNNIIQLFKTEEDKDIIWTRLHALSDLLNACEEDDCLDQVHNKILEAIDWYARYLDVNGFITEIPTQEQSESE